MKGNESIRAVCPLCGSFYLGRPSISREDDTTLICPDCGIKQALQSIGIEVDEQRKILDIIHEHSENLRS